MSDNPYDALPAYRHVCKVLKMVRGVLEQDVAPMSSRMLALEIIEHYMDPATGHARMVEQDKEVINEPA